MLPLDPILEHRIAASQASGGTSSNAIQRFVRGLLARHAPGGRLLDFGAGRGNLLRELLRRGAYSTLAGVDLFERPTDIDGAIEWHFADLNEPFDLGERYDVVVCSEVIEHLENPRQTFRSLARLLTNGGILVLTMPNQESIRSYLGLLLRGHFTLFLNDAYPAHITALLRMDLERLCAETGFTPLEIAYAGDGAIPGLTRLHWREVSLGLLRGRLFSDCIGLVARRDSGSPS